MTSLQSAYNLQIAMFHRQEERLRRTVDMDPRNTDGHLALADFLENWRDREGAVSVYRRAAEVGPQDPRPYAGEGRMLFVMRRFGDARAPLEKAVELDARDEESRRLLQHCLLNLGVSLDPTTINFRGLWLRKLKLDGQSLPDRDFSDTDMAVSSFRGAQLDRARFYRARVSQSDFSDASLRDGVLVEVEAEGANFIHADLTGAKLAKAKLFGAKFARAILDHVSARDAWLAQANLSGATMRQADFSNADLKKAELRDVDFADATLAGARLVNARLEGSDLSRAALTGASLAGARYDCRTRFPESFHPDDQEMIPVEPICTGVGQLRDFRRFSGFESPGVRRMFVEPYDFSGLDLRGADFGGALLGGTEFHRSDLNGANFARSRGGKFAGTDLSGTDFTGAKPFDGAFNRGVGGPAAVLKGTKFRGVALRLYTFVGKDAADLAVADLTGAALICSDTRGSVGAFRLDLPYNEAMSALRANVEQQRTLAQRLKTAQPLVFLDESCGEEAERKQP